MVKALLWAEPILLHCYVILYIGDSVNLDAAVRKVPDFPKPGILFYDITSIFNNPAAFQFCTDEMLRLFKDDAIDGVIAVESRGFMMGAIYAQERQIPLVLARKAGKLPGKVVSESYALEYGEATLEMQVSDLTPGKRWLIIDDLIATGGTLEAVTKMVEKQGATVAGIFSIIGLPFLGYDKKIGQYKTVTLVDYQGE